MHERWRSPWVTTGLAAAAAWIMIAIVGNNLLFYINSVGLLWVISYCSAALAFIILVRHSRYLWALAPLPVLAMVVMAWAGWSAGPASLGLGAVWILLGVLLMVYSYFTHRPQRSQGQPRMA